MIANVIKRYKYEDCIKSILQKGCSRLLDRRKIIRKIKINARLSSTNSIIELFQTTGKKIFLDEVHNVLKEGGTIVE